MDWRLLLVSLAGVFALAFVARLLGLGGGAIEDPDKAAQEAEAAVAGFQAKRIFLSADRRAALAVGADGDLVLLKQQGVHVAARRLRPPLALAAAGDTLVVRSGDPMFGQVTLRLSAEEGDALRRLV